MVWRYAAEHGYVVVSKDADFPERSFPLGKRRNRLTAHQGIMIREENPTEVRAMEFDRITVDPRQMGGVPCLRRLRIPVATVVGMIADGMSEDDILRAYPDLERADIREALRYAAAALQERELPLLP